MNELAKSCVVPSTVVDALRKRPMSGPNRLWPLLGIFVVAAILRISLFDGSGLSTGEPLAMATGHSLEHPAAAAQPELGDFVEPEGPVPAKEFSRYGDPWRLRWKVRHGLSALL